MSEQNDLKLGGGMSDQSLLTSAATKQVRHVFCRREAVVGDKTMRFEMRADGVWLWRRKSRKKKAVTWQDLVTVANGQGLLKL